MFACLGHGSAWRYPFVQWHGSFAVFDYQCHLAPATPERDPCFSDYIPMAEMAAFPLTLALAYPFARFAFSIFASRADERGRGWRLAGRQGGAGYFPELQIAGGVGIIWVALHAKGYPLALYPYLLYWGTWLLWFLLAISASWPHSGR